MPNYQKVESTDIEIGAPLQKALYDKNGILLIKAGGIIASESHLSILFEKEIFCEGSEDANTWISPPTDQITEATNTFSALDNAKIKLNRAFDLFRRGKAKEEFLPRIKEIALSLQQACLHDKDAAIANLHLDYDTPYAVVHHLQAAILCEIVGKRLGVKEEARLKLVQAALTHDIDLLDIQHLLDRYTLPLPNQYAERIRNHPKASAKALQELGVTDKNWLDAVEHHHERLDGSGYSDSLAGDSIRIPTRILAIADIYSAMIRDRPNRKAILTKEALRKLMMDHGGKNDARLTQILIKEIGVFPSGVIVQLADKEIAVVKHREENGVFPIVYAFIDPSGNPMLTPERRDTAKPENKIKSILPFADYRGSIAIIRNLWINPPA
ncbi:MAG: HD domain-containing protein [Betaproteobacteria bacterium]|nr:HD domain-containing protein [Betaproteobacteria bacterium]